ncbi:hypothetical protein [uncultured Acidovorax sp.]|uniref:hypothetical protein n=1 Tax=uncultured Acidovorax sp. TaxID=158751 RepID=UPI0025847F1E|nr:hypothetical protein [uncultured Acidovorax sp.]
MSFFSLKDKLEEFRYSYTPGDKLLNGAKLLGAVVANTAIGAGKVGKAVVDQYAKEGDKLREKQDK